MYWFLNSNLFARHKDSNLLAFEIYKHSTPLYRELQGVDIHYQENKVVNLKIAVPKINNLVIKPGERFSYWKIIGATTRKKGYVDGMELYYGKFRPGVGGGLCQLSNLLYWMFLHTPLTISERHRHSYDVFPDAGRKLPFGSGATCYYPFMDLEIVNDTLNTYQINLQVTDEYLVGEIRSDNAPQEFYKIYESEHRFNTEWWGGHTRHNKIVRDVFDRDDNLIRTENLVENHALCMYMPFLDSGMHT